MKRFADEKLNDAAYTGRLTWMLDIKKIMLFLKSHFLKLSIHWKTTNTNFLSVLVAYKYCGELFNW